MVNKLFLLACFVASTSFAGELMETIELSSEESLQILGRGRIVASSPLEIHPKFSLLTSNAFIFDDATGQLYNCFVSAKKPLNSYADVICWQKGKNPKK